MVAIGDVVDVSALVQEVKSGNVTERRHPEFGELAIYNYSPACQYENRWNEVTRLTRGLIVNTDLGEVVARGFPKFFNYGDEANTGVLSPDMPIMGAWDKIDGSLGIHYERPDGRWAIATRGSFASEQAVHATEKLRGTEFEFRGALDATWLWEIVYPGNRIVVDYGDRDELVYLGCVYNESGQFLPYASTDHEFPHAVPFEGSTLRDVLELAPRPNAEGLVVWFDEYTAVKIKQADYVALHRIVSNLTVKEVWRQLRAGTFDEFAAALPDEFHEWARETALPLIEGSLKVLGEARRYLTALTVTGLLDRKSQALWIQANAPVEYRGFLFGLLDGKDISDGIWKLLEPKGEAPRVTDE